MSQRPVTGLTLLCVPLVMAGALAVTSPARSQSNCSDSMSAFQSALKAGTAEALTTYIDQHAPCFEAPARARLAALGGTAAAAAEPATPDPNVDASAAAEVDPVPRGGSFLDNFWGGVAPKSKPTPLGDYDHKKQADGSTRINPPAAFLDMIPGADGMIAGFELGPDGRVVILDETATIIGRLPIDPPVPGSALSITADGMMIILAPDRKVLWSAEKGVIMEPVSGDTDTLSDTLREKLGGGGAGSPPADTDPGTAASAILGDSFVTATLTTAWRQEKGECLSANRAAEVLDGAAFMAVCAPEKGGDQVWRIHTVSAEDGTVRIVNNSSDQPFCLTANLGSGEATHRGGVYVDVCTDDEMQVWKIEPAPDSQPLLRIKVPALGPKICLEGNRFSPEAMMEGASFLNSCQNALGQFWIVSEVTP